MSSFNRVILVGNLTRDIELRYVGSGIAVTDIGLAVNDRVKRNDQWTEEVTFVDITLWGRTAEIANEYLSKGSSVLIEGRLKLDTWEKEGQKRSKLKVIGERMQMLGGRGGGSRSSGGGNSQDYSSDFSSGDSGDSYESVSSSASSSSTSPSPPKDEIPF